MPNRSNSLYFGKSCEHKIFSELLKQGFDVYIPLLDNKGIDCIVKKKDSKEYVSIQIKGRKPTWIFNVGTHKPTADYFVLIPPDNKIYTVPTKDLISWLDKDGKFTFTKDRKQNNKYLIEGILPQ